MLGTLVPLYVADEHPYTHPVGWLTRLMRSLFRHKRP
jgi:hypothetical protein